MELCVCVCVCVCVCIGKREKRKETAVSSFSFPWIFFCFFLVQSHPWGHLHVSMNMLSYIPRTPTCASLFGFLKMSYTYIPVLFTY